MTNIYAQTLISLAPVCYWRLGDASGVTAVDAMGVRNATYTGGPTLGAAGALTGDTNSAVTFNGSSQFASATSVPAPTVRTRTLTAWFKLSAATAASQAILADRTPFGMTLLVTATTGRLLGNVYNDAGTPQATVTSTDAVTDGNWHFAALTCDGTTTILYLDGAEAARSTASVAAWTNTPTQQNIAIQSGSTYFGGTLDELATFNTALTADQVAQLYALAAADYTGTLGIAAALADRFSGTFVAPPAGYRAIRLATYALPDQMPPTPCVLVFSDGGELATGNGTRTGSLRWTVRFYYDQAMDLPRQVTALLAWVDELATALQSAAQLGGLVARATIDAWSIGSLSYAGVDYAGIELKVTTATSESWSAAA